MLHRLLHSLRQDLRGGLRGILKRPVVSSIAVFSLALAIAGNSVIFSMVSAWLMHSWDYDSPETVAFVWQSKAGEFLGQSPASPANFVDWEQRSRSFEHWTAVRPVPLTLTGGEEAEAVTASEVSANLFPLFGVQPVYGRAFEAGDEVPGRNRVAILSHDFWTNRYGADPQMVGKNLEIGGEAYSIVGVLPSTFEFIFSPSQILVPLSLGEGPLPRGRRELIVIARLKDGIEAPQAEKEMQAIAKQLEKEYPEDNRDYSAKVLTLPDQFPGEVNERMFSLLQGLLLMVLLIACINVANLLLAQGQRRHKEIALRVALGAGRRRIIGQLLVESLTLALTGGLLGLGLGFLGIQATVAAFGNLLPASLTPSMDWRVLAFTLTISAFAGIVFGLTPALQASTPNLSQTLGDGGRGDGASRGKRWLARGLVVAEIAGALVMLSGAGLLVRSFLDLQGAEPGFRQEQLLTYQLNLSESGYPENVQVAELYDQVAETMRALPGVSNAAVATFLPRTPLPPSVGFTIDGQGGAVEEQKNSATIVAVGNGYSETLDVPLLRGRRFDVRDGERAQSVIVVNRALADRYWPEQDPLGQSITVLERSRQVVGVIGNVQQDLLQSTSSGYAPIVYVPQGQAPSRVMSVLLRTSVAPKTVVPSVREALRDIDADLTPALVNTMEEHVEQFFVGMNVINKLLAVFGLVALILAAVGIYGVIAFSVAQRTKEIGIRMAIGAQRWDVLRQVTWEGLVLALIGFAIGLPGVALMIWGLKRLLQDFSSVSPGTAGLVAILLFLVALAASIIPARRAAALDPLTALRFD